MKRRKERRDVREKTTKGNKERGLEWNLRSMLKCRNVVTKYSYKEKKPVK